MDSFEFESGRVLENVEVEYRTYGTPKYDDDGNLTNAVLFFSTFRDNYSFLRNSHEYLKNNKNFNAEFYFILITSLGSPKSCSPSTTGLRHNFPHYTFKDIINFKRQFLNDKFKIKRILGLIGEGLGGFEILTWACEYPDDMEFIFLLNTSYKNSGYRYIISRCIENIMDITDDYYSDVYSISHSKMLIAINTLIFAHSSSKKVFSNMENEELEYLLDEFIDVGLFGDIHDFKFYNECFLYYNLEDKLSNIKARSLFIGNNRNYFDYTLDMLPLKELIKDSIVLTHDFDADSYHFEDIQG